MRSRGRRGGAADTCDERPHGRHAGGMAERPLIPSMTSFSLSYLDFT
jgi:hypothetical protein